MFTRFYETNDLMQLDIYYTLLFVLNIVFISYDKCPFGDQKIPFGFIVL